MRGRKTMKDKSILLFKIALFYILFTLFGLKAYASGATDEIVDYTMEVNINDDATVSIDYHIDWLVLDSDELGPVEWLQIGIPNDHMVSVTALSDNISSVSQYPNEYGSYVRVDFYDKYYEGEHVVFDYNVVMDYMYEMNVLTEGETVYYFTPGWFDGIAVDNIVIRWSTDKAIANSHGAVVDGDHYVWSGSLSEGAKFQEVSVTYPSDAFDFDESKMVNSDDYSDDYYDDYDDSNSWDNISGAQKVGTVIGGLFGGLFAMIFSLGPFAFIAFIVYKLGKGLKSTPTTTTKKQIKRTLIKYYPTCPGCGAARPEGKEKCDYCGRSFIESEEVIEEKDIPNPTQYSSEGTFKYSDNSAIRVHVVNIPVVTHTSTRSSCAHSSCAHSSCACAHSCACACACACAGGGRAGCSTKDFYNTNLKLKQLEFKKKKKN